MSRVFSPRNSQGDDRIVLEIPLSSAATALNWKEPSLNIELKTVPNSLLKRPMVGYFSRPQPYANLHISKDGVLDTCIIERKKLG